MFLKPASIQDILTKNNYHKEVYEAINNEDLSEVIMLTKKIIEETHDPNPLSKIKKIKETSEKYREMGNTAYNNDSFQHSLVLYNQAIVHAPPHSKELKLALGNRSALFFKQKAYKACIKDIDQCLLSECPEEICSKLYMRRQAASKFIQAEESKALDKRVEIHINCDITRNILVPCASTDVKFTGSVLPKVLASKEIKVGTVVAYEKAYVSYTDEINALVACHYCQRKSLNLIPCDNCSVVLYCDEECKTQCYNEYHKHECYLMDVLKMACESANLHLMMKTVFKLISECDSWAELIRESQSMGLERMKKSSIEDIFDGTNIYSVLNVKDDRPFIYGGLYNASFVCGTLLHYMEDIPSFFPTDANLKQQAMRAISRIMLFLSIHQVSQQTFQVVTNLNNGLINNHRLQNYGIYSFIGKLKTSCNPNSFLINDNNKLILLAIRTIKSGEELTISSQQHWLDGDSLRHNRNIDRYMCSGTLCGCPICTGEGSLKCREQLSESQLELYKSLPYLKIHDPRNPRNLNEIYNKLLIMLDYLQDVPYSMEYYETFQQFRKCISYFEALKGNNVAITGFSSGDRTRCCIGHPF